MTTNISRAQKLIQKLYEIGVRHFVMCPGGRNAPFVDTLESCTSQDISIHWGFEERSAGFYALGLTMKQGQPVAVFTTSGTAFVETCSALLEAHYSGWPLIVISADRPEIMWGSGAPQTMKQKDFLLSHLGASVDETFDPNKVSYPLHINCIFDEPLLDAPTIPWLLEPGLDKTIEFSKLLNPYNFKFLEYSLENIFKLTEVNLKTKKTPKLLLIFSGLNKQQKLSWARQLKKLQADYYFESTGEMDAFPSHLNAKNLNKMSVMTLYDLVIRIGGIPTHRVWRDFEIAAFKKVIHFSELPLPGLSFGEVFKLNQFAQFLSDLEGINILNDMKLTQNHSDQLEVNLSHEEVFFKQLKQLVVQLHLNQNKSFVGSETETVFYLGNSLPIRSWDADKTNTFNEVYASRGLNGIDGQLSTALGLAYNSKHQKTIAVLGDLTTMYDLAAAWYWVKNLDKVNFTLFIINNKGGQIFAKMFKNPKFINKHDVKFASWAEMWGLSYLSIQSIHELENQYKTSNAWPNIIECDFT